MVDLCILHCESPLEEQRASVSPDPDDWGNAVNDALCDDAEETLARMYPYEKVGSQLIMLGIMEERFSGERD